jgi:D-3-phosphoglycerate dehydrogenase
MKVLIADKFEKVGIDGLKELGCTVISEPDIKADALPDLIRKVDPNILIVRSKRVTVDALRAGTGLTLVIRAGAGIDTIDVTAASDLGVFVSNCPGKNSIAVAELVMGLLLACDRRIPDQVSDLRQGKWNKAEYSKARGSVVDEAALQQAIRERGIRAGLDVFQNEPASGAGEFSSALAQASGVYGTHHVGASTDQAQVAIAHEVIRIVQAFRSTGEVPNVVNRLARSSATHVLTIRHRNRPGVLAHVFGVLAGAAINVEEVENIIYHGAQATLARIHLDGQPESTELARIRDGNPDIISAELSTINGKSRSS